MNKRKDDVSPEMESQFILRLPPEHAATVRRIIQAGNVGSKGRLTIEIHPHKCHGMVQVDGSPLVAKVVDLPCNIESLKTIDKKTFYKTADISQVLVCTEEGEEEDLCPPPEKSPVPTDPTVNKTAEREKRFILDHGISGPLKNVRKRRFRRTAKKKYIESPDIEKEVKRLLSTDAEAVNVRWELVAEEESKEAGNPSSLLSSDVPPGMSNRKSGHSSSERDKLRELFNDLSSSSSRSSRSSSSSSEDEDDEINIDDMEEELERKLEEQLSDLDGQDQEKEETNLLALRIQEQIDNLKSKLQENEVRARRQEDLIKKVENMALKARLENALEDLRKQEEQDQLQLNSLQEQLESIMQQ
ncbi:transcription initiation factor TFIID subunit 7-like [Ornithorhynchus anatinus]|uniref:transcription initiation factor TFIID subunit 7-like n=1 Tax=Ornithorhynchus anatinus TaxID=9258 RepID=UPI0010A7B5E4|nr:transcription initiation factor TFIID subunit 7-like [Ornithorhynchus anatinus]XP_028923904.1 transcription initiation factor TFIID subunit 7-like [Ornithorhynchus anatinus]XP_028923905.1 transcription initiation factor TFIID subunit 7-like [Ornithorhynchus anatinus]XP_028923906.1 transcription initiation factor TFIID subunit 7-like [Ornithorhynchus anatinus]XP_028923907.1 transcription initiation factor TFIID subunit 7-like [Ornithorhynchus anatinus]XP_039768398.1 transcription initiation 